MRALLDQEVDMEELFEYRDSDEEDEEFSTNGKHIELSLHLLMTLKQCCIVVE